MPYHEKNAIHMCLVKQKNPISLMGICVLYRRDPIPDSIPDSLACLGVLRPSQTSAAPNPDQPDKPNLSGTWMLDLKASTSVESLMKQIGAGLLERKYATSTKLHLQQTIAFSGPQTSFIFSFLSAT